MPIYRKNMMMPSRGLSDVENTSDQHPWNSTNFARLNINSTHSTLVPPYWDLPLTVVLATMITIFMVAAVLGNGMVLAVIIRHRGMRTRTNMFLASLATADLLVAVLDMPVSLVTVTNGDWIFNDAFCIFNGFTMAFFLITSIHTLMHISIHKYITITRPFSRVLTFRRVVVMIGCAWIWGGLSALLTVTGLNTVEYKPSTTQCGPSYPKTNLQYGHTAWTTITCYLVPLCIMVFCYFNMFQEIRGYTKRLRDHTNQEKDQVLAQQKRITITLFIVIAVFFLCWTPYIVYSMWAATIEDKTKVPYYANAVSYWFGYMNSACNPIIYALRSPSFREGFKEIMCQGRAYISEDMLDNLTTTETEGLGDLMDHVVIQGINCDAVIKTDDLDSKDTVTDQPTMWRKLSQFARRSSFRKSPLIGSTGSTPQRAPSLTTQSSIAVPSGLSRLRSSERRKVVFRNGQAYYLFNNHIYHIRKKSSRALLAGIAQAKLEAKSNGRYSPSTPLKLIETPGEVNCESTESLIPVDTHLRESTGKESGQENSSENGPVAKDSVDRTVDMHVERSQTSVVDENKRKLATNLNRLISRSEIRLSSNDVFIENDEPPRRRSNTLDLNMFSDAVKPEALNLTKSNTVPDRMQNHRERRRRQQRRLPSVEHLDLRLIISQRKARHRFKQKSSTLITEDEERDRSQIKHNPTKIDNQTLSNIVSAGNASMAFTLPYADQDKKSAGVDNPLFGWQENKQISAHKRARMSKSHTMPLHPPKENGNVKIRSFSDSSYVNPCLIKDTTNTECDSIVLRETSL